MYETRIDISRQGFANIQQTAELLEIIYQGRGDANGLFNAIASAPRHRVVDAINGAIGDMPNPPGAGRNVTLRFRDIPDARDKMEEIARRCGCIPSKGPYASLGIGSLSLLARKLGEVEPEILADALEDVIEREDR